MDKYEKYLKVVKWACDRYKIKNKLVIQIGDTFSEYSKIEKLAFERYLK